MNELDTIHVGDCRRIMERMIATGMRVDCIVTSPPYWGLRDYGVPGQFGLERTWQRHVARMRGVFRLARELLADDGTLWLNYGDSYAGSGGQSPQSGKLFKGRRRQRENVCLSLRGRGDGLKEKDLVGMPWRIAFALQADGWYLRSDIVWHKPNPMPESIRDRPTKSHEYVFLMSRSDRYFYDPLAIAEPTTGNAHARGSGVNKKIKTPDGWDTRKGEGAHGTVHKRGRDKGATKTQQRDVEGLKVGTRMGRKAGWRGDLKQDAEHPNAATTRKMTGFNARWARNKQNASFSAAVTELVETRNARSVWTIGTEAFSASHFATFPRELVRRCILAGSRPGGIIFDPFMGSGTVAEMALSLGRRFVGCELNPEYAALFEQHRSTQRGFAI